MIYGALKFLFYFAIKGYFRSISIRNLEYTHCEGPVIFVANHTSAFMDPLVLGLHIRQRLWFLARGEAFKNRLLRYVLTRLHMIPIYRPEVSPDEVVKNEEIFHKCYDHLAKSKCMLIFPEGFSKTERRIRKLKTGTARIALGAESEHQFDLGIKIIPAGINYSNPHLFQSALFIHFARPINVSDYRDHYREDSFGAVRVLTDEIKTSLEESSVVIANERLDQLVKNIEKLYRGYLRQKTSTEEDINVQNFYLSKEIVRAVTYFYEHERAAVEKLIEKIEYYMGRLRKLHIKDAYMKNQKFHGSLALRAISLILLFPLHLYGLMNNYIPFKIASYIASRLVKREDFQGSLQLAAGMFTFLAFYVIQTVTVSLVLNPWIGLLYLVSLYPSGLFCLHYIREYRRMRRHIRFFSLFIKSRKTVTLLAMQRQNIIDELERGRIAYLRAMKVST